MSKYHCWNFSQAAFLSACLWLCIVAVPFAPARAQYEHEPEELILAVIYPPYMLSEAILAVQKDGIYYLPMVEMGEMLDF